MKRFFLAALAIAAIASCAKNEVNEVADNSQITFQTVVGPQTKALVTGTAYSEAFTFGTVAYKVNGGSELYIPISEVSYNTSVAFWSTATPYYWPKDGSTLTFYSYSPFKDQNDDEINVSSTADGITITDYGVATRQETDLMVADAATGQTQNTTTIGSWVTGVSTVFKHKLAQVVAINFQTVDNNANVMDYAKGHTAGSYEAGDKVFIINNVKLKNIFETGTYTNATAESWNTVGSMSTEISWHTNTHSVAFNAGEYNTTRDGSNYRLVLPQTFETTGTMQQLEVNYTIKTYTDDVNFATETITETVDLADLHTAWEMNKKYTYIVKIGLDRIYWAPSVVEWETETVTAAPEDVI